MSDQTVVKELRRLRAVAREYDEYVEKQENITNALKETVMDLRREVKNLTEDMEGYRRWILEQLVMGINEGFVDDNFYADEIVLAKISVDADLSVKDRDFIANHFRELGV